MTNKQLIDHCNSFWDIKGKCGDCPYNHNYCNTFTIKYIDTPFMLDTLLDGKFYTDEEIKCSMKGEKYE